MSLLEGKEVEKKLGDYGTATVDVTPDLKIVAEVKVQIDLVAELEKLAAKTATPVDDAAIKWVKSVVQAASALG